MFTTPLSECIIVIGDDYDEKNIIPHWILLSFLVWLYSSKKKNRFKYLTLSNKNKNSHCIGKKKRREWWVARWKENNFLPIFHIDACWLLKSKIPNLNGKSWKRGTRNFHDLNPERNSGDFVNGNATEIQAPRDALCDAGVWEHDKPVGVTISFPNLVVVVIFPPTWILQP